MHTSTVANLCNHICYSSPQAIEFCQFHQETDKEKNKYPKNPVYPV